MIWGMALHPGEEFTRKVQCDEHLSLASLECRVDKSPGGGRPSACLLLKIGRGQHVLCTLEEGVANQQCLDLILEQGESITFLVKGTVQGKKHRQDRGIDILGIVYLTGYTFRKRQREQSWPVRESEGGNTGIDNSFQGGTQHEVDEDDHDGDDDMTQEVSGNHGDDEGSCDDNDDGDHIATKGGCGHNGVVEGGNNDLDNISGEYYVESIAMDDNSHPGNVVRVVQGVENDIIFKGNADTGNRNHQGSGHDGLNSEKQDQGVVLVEKVTEEGRGENVGVSRRKSKLKVKCPKIKIQGGDSISLTEVGRHGCFICLESFVNKADCTAHENICEKGNQWKNRDQEPHRCQFCSKPFDIPSLKLIHEKRHLKEKMYGCRFCEKKFATTYSAKKHEHIHTKEERLQCPLCPKTYMSNCHLVEHMRSHTGEKPFQCHICQTVFSTVSAHNRHIRRHRTTYPFCCETCGKGFSTQKKLAQHTKLHTDEPTLKCRHCDMAFVVYYHRTRHEKLVHSS